MSTIFEKEYKHFGIFYSVSKRFPTVKIASPNPLGELNVSFWKKIKYFAGISVTTTMSPNPNDKEKLYAYSRLELLGESNSMEVKFYERQFSKEHIKLHFPKIENPYEDGFDYLNSEYYEAVIDFIHGKHNSNNSLVLCGGYKETDILYDLYKNKYNDVPLHCSQSEEKPRQLLKDSKKKEEFHLKSLTVMELHKVLEKKQILLRLILTRPRKNYFPCSFDNKKQKKKRHIKLY